MGDPGSEARLCTPGNLLSPWGPASMDGGVWHLHLSCRAGEFILGGKKGEHISGMDSSLDPDLVVSGRAEY